MRRAFVGMLLIATAAALPSGARAQQQGATRFGAQVSFGHDIDFGLGARVRVPIYQVLPGFAVDGAFDYFFPGGDLKYWELNANANYTVLLRNASVEPYFGGGLNLAHASVASVGDTNLGLNVVLGTRIGKSAHLNPYIEAREELRSGGKLVLTAGLLL